MSTWYRMSSIFNHYCSTLSFSCTSFLSIFYQKMIACSLFPKNNIMFLLYVILKHNIIPKKQYNVVTVHGSRPPPEVPVNQSSISCNDQGGQNNVINDSIQQTTPFPTSFPETMVSTPICYNVHWISKCLYYTKSFMFSVSISSIFKLFTVKQTDNNWEI
jgi:hypothetical protein